MRCWWAGDDPLYRRYHDSEWGHPIADDRHLFELLSLEAFQSGLSWLTILRKRDGFRAAFSKFDLEVVATYDERDVERLLGDAGIVRNRAKITATINNASRCLELVQEKGSFAEYVWGWAPAPASRPKEIDHVTLLAMATTPESTTLAKDLKKRGWRHVGPTTAYSFMQSAGLVNDHLEGCDFREEVEEARRAAGHG